jgi:trimethylamine:corrinoid methyltransferase-like protein
LPSAFLQGVQACTETLALDTFAKIGAQGDFLKLPETRKLFRQEQHIPAKVIDRGSLNSREQSGKKDAFAQSERTSGRLQAPELLPEVERRLRSIVEELAKRHGMEHLPAV